jgi:ribosomal protein S18 acetylase RimI-like enzyme
VTFTIRRATEADADALGRLGALLLRAHHDFDPRRFMAPGKNPEAGYGWFLNSQLGDDDVAVFVAERDGEVIGYVYAGLEPRSWKELREACGFIHDVAVREEGRRTGIASALIETAIEWLRSRGAPRVVLWTADANAPAQQLFDRLGFRRTMVEMTREL